MRKRWAFGLLVFGAFPMGIAFGEFRTPGTGEVYTLEDLALLAGEALQKVDTGFVLRDRLVISAKDELRIAGGEMRVGTAETRQRADGHGNTVSYEVIPCVMIAGTLRAEGWTVRSVPMGECDKPGHGVIVGAVGGEDAAEATLSNCAFEGLAVGVTVRGGSKTVAEGCRFVGCIAAGAAAYTDGCVSMRGCSFQGTGLNCTGRSKVLAEGCSFEGAGIDLLDSVEGSTVSGCTLTGERGIGLYVVGNSKVSVQSSRIRGFDYGAFFGGASKARFEDSVICGSRDSAVLCDNKSAPMLRRNRIRHTALEALCPGSDYVRPAILVMDSSAPDLGTATDPGLNAILSNGELAIYHAGTQTVPASGNDWGTGSEEAVERMIYHQPDDGEDADGSGFRSGPVLFLPLLAPSPGAPFRDLGRILPVDRDPSWVVPGELARNTQ